MPTSTRAPRSSPDQRRAQIADAARDLALDEGLASLTLRAVASRTRVTPALVAHYVPSMDDLVASTFSAVVDAELSELSELAGLTGLAGLAASGTAPARLARLLNALLDGSRDDVTLVWVEAFALGRRSETLAAAARDAMDRWQSVLRDLLADGVAEGSLRIDDPADAAWQLLGMIDGINAQSLVRWGGASDRSALMLRAVEGMLGLDHGALDPKCLDPKNLDPKSLDPKSLDPKSLDPKSLDPKRLDPKNLDPKSLDPKNPDEETS